MVVIKPFMREWLVKFVGAFNLRLGFVLGRMEVFCVDDSFSSISLSCLGV